MNILKSLLITLESYRWGLTNKGRKIVNRKFYAEMPELELDLSADALWHIRVGAELTNS